MQRLVPVENTGEVLKRDITRDMAAMAEVDQVANRTKDITADQLTLAGADSQESFFGKK